MAKAIGSICQQDFMEAGLGNGVGYALLEFGLVYLFNGITTLVGYLTPMPSL